MRQPIHSQSRPSRLNKKPQPQHIIASANAQMLKMLHAAREGRIRESKSRIFRPEFPPSRIKKEEQQQSADSVLEEGVG